VERVSAHSECEDDEKETNWKGKTAATQPEHDDKEDNKSAGEPTKINELQQLMNDLEEFVSTATGVAEGIGALYGTQASNTEV
jgi:hypothetical protein